MTYNEDKIKELINRIKPVLIEISKELGRGYNFKGSAIDNKDKKDCRIIIENDIRL